jgi:hypothetical protein
MFITFQEVIDLTVLQQNVEQKKVNLFIKSAESEYVIPILSNNLYQHLVDVIDSGTANLYELALIDLTKDYHAWAVLLNGITFFNVDFNKIGVNNRNTDYSNPLDFTNLNYVKNDLKNQLALRSKLVNDYIAQNITQFPSYEYKIDCVVDSSNNLQNQNQKNIGGLFFY